MTIRALSAALAAALMVAGVGAASAAECGKAPIPTLQPYYALAISWQAAFCETKKGAPPECRAPINAAKATRFTLHGLWPQGEEYCSRGYPATLSVPFDQAREMSCEGPKGWAKLPTLPLAADVATDLTRVMPGVKSRLDGHEFVKHGTCSGQSAEDYFRGAIHLTDLANQPPASGGRALPEALLAHAGREISVAELCQAVRDVFGTEGMLALEADINGKATVGGAQRTNLLTELRFWLQPAAGDLGLTAAHFVPVPDGATTLGPVRARQLCTEQHLGKRLYIDRPGLKK